MPKVSLPSGLHHPRVTFMDCDGIIFDANGVKVAAFEKALADEPAGPRAELIAHHKQTGGISRYEKLRRFYTEMVPSDEPESAIAGALERFSQASVAGYRSLEHRPEALRFAEAMGGTEAVYVVSGSDGEELRQVFAEHDLLGCFADVLGSPTKKVPHMRRVLEERGLAPGDALMIGDGRGDLEACHALGVPFIFLREMSEWTDADAHLTPGDAVAPDWATVLDWL